MTVIERAHFSRCCTSSLKMTAEDFDNIPILDLSQAEDPIKKPLLLKRLRHILFNVGFLYISNTGVPNVYHLLSSKSHDVGSSFRVKNHHSSVFCSSCLRKGESLVPELAPLPWIQRSRFRNHSFENRLTRAIRI